MRMRCAALALAMLFGACDINDVPIGSCRFEYDDVQIARVDPHRGTQRWVAERPWIDDRLRALHDENTMWTWSTLSGDELVAHDLTSGAERWRWVPGSDMFTVAKVGDTLVVHVVGKVVGLDPDTGELRWTYVGESPYKFASTPQNGDQQWSPPAEMLDGPVVLNDNGTVIAIDPASGSELWRASTAGSTSFAPMVAGDLVLHPADPGVLHAFDVASGSERWAWGAPDDQQLSARVDTVGELVVVSTSVLGPTNAAVSGELVALDRATGDVRWARPFLPFYDWGWNVTDETLVVRSARLDGTPDSSATLTRIDLTTGRDLWTRDIVSLVTSDSVTDSDSVWIVEPSSGRLAQATARLSRIDLDAGSVVWEHVGDVPGRFATAGDIVALALGDSGDPQQRDAGQLIFFDRSNGEVVSTVTMRDPPQIGTFLVDGSYLVVAYDDALGCL